MAKRVLIVDDDPAQRRILEETLKRQGFETRTAASGEQALQILESPDRGNVNLVLLDLVMPEPGGMAVLERVQGKSGMPPIIVQTAHGSIDAAINAMRLGAADFVIKPASPERLEVSIRHDDILVSLLGRALAMLPSEAAERMAEEVGIEYGKAMAAAIDPSETHRSYQGALHAVADALSAHGFAARAESDGDEYQIVAQNCPFGDAVVEHPVICAVDRGIVQGMLGFLHGGTAGTDTASSKPRGDEVCVTLVTR